MPSNNDAEMSVLGAMMLSKDAIGDVVELLKARDFYTPRHITIFNAVTDLYAADEPAEPISVAAHLLSKDPKAFERFGGINYLHDCVSATPTAANATYYGRLVAERATERRLIEAGYKVVQLGFGGDGVDLADRVDRAQQAVYDVIDNTQRGDFRDLGSLLQPTLDQIEEFGDPNRALEQGIPTGFTDLDRLFNNLQAGQVVIIAGRPGIGKSILGVNIATTAACKHNIPAAIFSMEMSFTEITMRILASEARVPLNILRSGRLSDDDWAKLARRMGEIGEAPLYVDESVDMTMMEIIAKARRLVQKLGVRLIVVDYLQLINTPGRQENRQLAVTALSRGFKVLAKLLNITVIVLAQLNRGPEGRQDKRPQLSDLRESGSIEQDCDICILLHRDDYYDKESPRAGEADFIVAKHRNGATDTITVAAQLHLSRFVDMAII